MHGAAETGTRLAGWLWWSGQKSNLKWIESKIGRCCFAFGWLAGWQEDDNFKTGPQTRAVTIICGASRRAANLMAAGAVGASSDECHGAQIGRGAATDEKRQGRARSLFVGQLQLILALDVAPYPWPDNESPCYMATATGDDCCCNKLPVSRPADRLCRDGT